MRKKSFLAATLCAAALAAVSSTAAFAGEITGNGKPTAAPAHAQSICSFSGQNHVEGPDDVGRVQSFGQIVAAGGKAFLAPEELPGSSCNGRTGFLAGGGGE